MYNILVIDDAMSERNREEIYDFILKTKFEYTKIINDLSELKNCLDYIKFDCIILDNNLDIGENKSKILNVIEDYDLPIIIVSNTRRFDTSDWDLHNVIDCISLKPFFQLKSLLELTCGNELQSTIEETVKLVLSQTEMQINKAIYKARRYYNNVCENRLTICHISDLQFGDPSANQIDLVNFFAKLETFINGRPIRPDLIVITGDIVYSGYKNQFDLAKDAISKFMNKIYGGEKENRILIVPGNHDFNYNCYIVDENKENYELSKKSLYNFAEISSKLENININKMKKLTITPNDFEKFEGSDICLHDFSKFAYELTKDERYFSNDFFIRKKTLLNKGFEIVGINNTYKFFRTENDKIRYDFDYNKVAGNINNSKQRSIIVGHATPDALGFNQACVNKRYRCNKNYDQECAEDGCQKWGTTERIMTELNGIIYLHGHGHFSDYKLSKDKAKLFISAGSPSGINKIEKTFNIIEIEEDSDLINLNIVVNKCTSVGVKYCCNYKLSYNKEKKIWTEIDGK